MDRLERMFGMSALREPVSHDRFAGAGTEAISIERRLTGGLQRCAGHHPRLNRRIAVRISEQSVRARDGVENRPGLEVLGPVHHTVNDAEVIALAGAGV